MRFHGEVTNLEALGCYRSVDDIASIHFNKPRPQMYRYKSGGGNSCNPVVWCRTPHAGFPVPVAVTFPHHLVGNRRSLLPATLHPLPPSISMPATRSTTKQRRKTQTSRRNAARQDRRDYHKCDTCGGLFSRYHSAHKRHIKLCGTRNQELRDKEAQLLEERDTPTPEPYTRISGSTEIEFGPGAESDGGVAVDHGMPFFQCCCPAPILNSLQVLLLFCPLWTQVTTPNCFRIIHLEWVQHKKTIRSSSIHRLRPPPSW